MYTTTPEGQSALTASISKGLEQFNPPPSLTVSQWADRYARLPREASAEHGQWFTSRAEYQREPMDAINDPLIETIVLMWAAQLGKTAIELHILGYFAHQDPSPILFLMPTLETAEAVSKDRISTMIRDTPALRPLFGDPRSRDSGNTLLHKVFPGGHLTLAGANSPASLSSRPIRIRIADEIDRYGASAGTEGDPIKLANARLATFWNRKKIDSSTPGTRGISRIEKGWEVSDQRKYHVPCPHCGQLQTLAWDNLKWPSPRTGAPRHQPEKCYYVCVNGCEILESDKAAMILGGKWIAAKPGNGDGRTAGFHLNQLYSPFKFWPEIIEEFLDARTPEMLKTFVNTVLAETWEVQGESVKDGPLLNRREAYNAQVPEGVLILTAGVDVQQDRIEVEVVGWGRDRESWGIENRVFAGKTSLPQVWKDLDLYLQSPFRHECGVDLMLSATFIDSGYRTTEVYNFCHPRQARKVFACKGDDGMGRPIVGTARQAQSKKGRKRALLFPVGIDTAKELIYSWLNEEKPGPGYCHFPLRTDATAQNDYDGEYFKQLTAEKMIRKVMNGFETLAWIKTRDRNEALDKRAYALAALETLRVKWESVAEGLQRAMEQRKPVPAPAPEPKSPLPPQARPPTRPVRNNWVNSWRW